jgi:hypothetical protein
MSWDKVALARLRGRVPLNSDVRRPSERHCEITSRLCSLRWVYSNWPR